MAKKKKKTSFLIKILISVFALLFIGLAITAYFVFDRIYQPNVFLGQAKTAYVCIPTGSKIEDVSKLLHQKGYIINQASFEWLSEMKNYKNNVYPGRYKIKAGMNNNELINLLRSAQQEPLKLTFNSIRTKEQLAGVISTQIEADSVSLLKLLNDEFFMKKFHLSSENSLCLFIPNTYEFYWNTSAEKFINKMGKEYAVFWTTQRKLQAEKIGLSPVEVSVLASVVQAEQSVHNDEKPIVAGLYLNRISKGMNLESDPTLVYALGDFTINRVLNVHKEIESPYNTYKYPGLPPGPINLPELSSLKAVLNYDMNDYLFMCAKEDFSGFHNFAKTYEEHCVNAKKYWAALDKKNIMR